MGTVADLSHGIDRLAGYRDAIDSFDPALVAHGDYSYASGMAATERPQPFHHLQITAAGQPITREQLGNLAGRRSTSR